MGLILPFINMRNGPDTDKEILFVRPSEMIMTPLPELIEIHLDSISYYIKLQIVHYNILVLSPAFKWLLLFQYELKMYTANYRAGLTEIYIFISIRIISVLAFLSCQ